MNNRMWIYANGVGTPSKVVLKHGVQSGNLVIFCNNKVLLIDFDVFHDKVYSFFIDEELCRIHVKWLKNGQYQYTFEIEEDVDTPLNRYRKKREHRDSMKGVFIAIGVVTFLVVVVVGNIFWYRYKLAKEIEKDGQMSIATLTIGKYWYKGKSKNIRYQYTYNQKEYYGYLQLPSISGHPVIGQQKLPIADGDQFTIRFLPRNPRHCKLSHEQLLPEQQIRYRQRIKTTIIQQEPKLDEAYVSCLVDAAYHLDGLNALADLYYRNSSTRHNSKHNEKTYQQLLLRPELKEALWECQQ